MATGRIGTNTVLTTRWSKAPAGGTTSLSGLDDNSVSLVYSVGYEQVYRNGVLLSRGNDYTATNGTTITLIDATITGDIIEVFANATIPLTDTYSQTVANGKFINNTLTTTTGDIIYASAANTPARLGIGSTGNVLTVSGGVPAWSAPAGGWTELATANLPTNANTVTISSISTDYRMLVVMMQDFYATDNDYLLVRFNGNSNQDYGQIAWYHSAENTVSNNANGINNAIEPNLDSFLNAQRDNFFYLQIPDYSNATTHKSGTFNGKARNAGDTYNMNLSGTFQFASTSAITSVTLATNSSNWAGGSYIIYGVK